MAPVVVTGAQPGPGLWRVSRDGHVLHILGTQSPLPGDIQWQADEVRQVLAEAGTVLQAPEVGVKADVGLLRGLVLVPAAYRAMRNPGGRSLQQVLPPDLYARWSRLKARYLGRERGIGKRRPAIAAYQLYRAAREEHGLRADGDRVVWPLIASVVDTRGLQPVATGGEIKVEDPRRALAEFRAEPLWPQNLECFRRTLDLVEHQLPQAVRRANAWATGDIAALRAMPDDGGQASACLAAWMASDTARRRGLDDIEARVRGRWVEAALAALEALEALEAHPVSFAVLPVGHLLHDRHGFIAALRARGCRVQAPDGEDAETGVEADAAPPEAARP